MAYAAFLWMPNAVRISEQQAETQIQKTLDAGAEGLVSLLLEGQLDSIYLSLNSLSDRNPEWVYLSLSDATGLSIYPFEEKQFAETNEKLKRIEVPVVSDSEVIGKLALIYDSSPFTERIEKDGFLLLSLLAGALIFVAIAIGSVFQLYIIKPVKLVSMASKALVENKEFLIDFVAPETGNDEIGRMVDSFILMRKEMLATQNKINQVNVDLASSAHKAELAKEKLDLERTRLNAILDNMSQGVITIDEKGFIRSCNRPAERTFGYLAREIIGENVKVLMTGADRDHHDGYLETYMSNEQSALPEGKTRVLGKERVVKGLKKNGLIFPMGLNVTEIRLEDERIFIGMVRDITKEQEKEKALIQFKKTLDQTMDCIFMFSPDPIKFFYVNKGALEQVGYSRQELYAMNPYDIMEEYSGVLFRSFVEQLMASKTKAANFESLHQHKDGRIIPVVVSLQYFDFEGDTPHFMAVVRDVSKEKQSEKEILEAMKRAQEAKQEADKANEAKGQFLANMSHELRTPMNGIIGLSGLLLDASLNDDEHESLKSIHNSGQNLLLLLNDLLDFSKIESGELSFEYTPYSPREILVETISNLAPLAAKKSIVLEQTCSPELPPNILGDGHRFRQILYNLIGNAIKFTKYGHVNIAVEFVEVFDGKGHLLVNVGDTGIGIPEEKLETIFLKFSQADDSTTRQFGGTGLGLTICKQIVELMGGEIGVESKVGEGSVFWFKLPVEVTAIDSDTDAKDDEKTAKTVSFEAFSALIVDDHPVNTLFAKKLMKNWNFGRIETAEHGKRALELIEKNDFDVVLMDCQMPEMDGFETSRRIRSMEDARGTQNPIYILATTADAMQGVKQECLDSGMDEYITKPLNVQKLLKKLTGRLKPKVGQGLNAKAPCAAKGEKPSEEQSLPDPVDLTNLDFYTDSDPEIEKEFVETFFVGAKEGIEDLLKSACDGKLDEFHAHAHKFKGAAATLGAVRLVNLCREFENLEAIPEDVEGVIGEITSELEIVMSFMKGRQLG